MWIFFYGVNYYFFINHIYLAKAQQTIESIKRISPKKTIDHLRTFLNPLSFEVLNNSKSPEPTKAPEKPLESGDISIEITKIPAEIITKIIDKIALTSIFLFSWLINYFILYNTLYFLCLFKQVYRYIFIDLLYTF
ncbi:putative transmembrane protein [Mycoplasmopsis bovis HB0801]|nr:putative transmembrane protein [Mycoplasmopsis bovis HB0801]